MVDVQQDRLCQTCARIPQGYCDGADPEELNSQCDFYKRMINADRVRAMTLERLAFLIGHRDCPTGHFWGDATCKSCVQCWLNWLKQEVI